MPGALHGQGTEIQRPSSRQEIGLAQHLRKIGARMYSAYWCPFCQRQKELFGREAFAQIDHVECDPKGENARPQLCQAAGVRGYPTWVIRGRSYPGLRSLEQLAAISGYKP
jgi:glutaredoxin